jgi:predicted metal-binding membrane protein
MLPSALWYRRNATFAAAYLAVWLGLALVALQVPCRATHGLRHGLDCAGSSAGLMVAFFGLGLMSVWWMAAVAAVVFAEKAAPHGRRFVVPAGLALIAAGLITIA